MRYPLLTLLWLWGLSCAGALGGEGPAEVERWGLWEHSLPGPATGNPDREVTLTATFRQGPHAIRVSGFYDGEGRYKFRFMPPTLGEWTYSTTSNCAVLTDRHGRFTSLPPTPANHGPVMVHDTHHFAYADGTRHHSLGTTCYAWTHQDDDLQEQTLQTLRSSPFNKLRMCVFPKNYAYNAAEPPRYPFFGRPGAWDTTRFNPEFFRHLEQRVAQLADLGIEADLILFHPYDKGRWGFDRMTPEDDERYLQHVVARFAAFRNVWWSLANEYDFMEHKTEADWDRLCRLVSEADPSHHLLSIHNGTRLYNHNQPWITHVSLQNGSAVAEPGRGVLYRDVYRKPIVFDEVKYEGNLEERWGNISAEELVHRFWIGTIEGMYVGHGETYKHPQNIIWWAKGGRLHGNSPARLAFLKQVLDGNPPGLEPIDKWQESRMGGRAGEYAILYFGKDAPTEWTVSLPHKFSEQPVTIRAELIDAWNMTITPVEGVFPLQRTSKYQLTCPSRPAIKLPGRPMQAIRVVTVR
jgi:hypothetical protein